jgi:MYXO-CTERM domain-containing protein
MNSLSSNLFRAAALAIALPVIGVCAAITLPTSVSQVSAGMGQEGALSGSSGGFALSGNYSVAYDSTGSHFGFYPTVTYTGPTLASADTVTVDLTGNIFDPSPGTFDGTYDEDIPVMLGGMAPGSATGQIFIDGQSVGLVSYGPGNGDFDAGKISKVLSGLNGNTLSYDFQLAFTFGPDTTTGTIDSSPAPEPAETIPAAVSLVGFALLGLRRRKK